MTHSMNDSVTRSLGDSADDMPGLIPAYAAPYESSLPVPPGLAPTSGTGPGVVPMPEQSAAAPNTTTATKRKKAPGAGLTSSELADRRQQVESRIVALEAVLDAAETVPPTLTAPVPSMTSRPLRSAARDVWYSMAGTDSKDTVPESDIDSQVEADTLQQGHVPFDQTRRPSSEYLRCKLCL